MDVRGEGDHRKNYLVEKIFYFSIKKCLKPHLGFTHGYKVGTSIRNGAYNTRNTYIYDVFGRTESDVFAVRTETATSAFRDILAILPESGNIASIEFTF
jgi:hypothetical protein